MDRVHTIKRRIAAYSRRRDRINRTINRIAMARLVIFVVFLAGFSFSFDGDYTYPGAAAALASVLGFLYVMVLHDRCYRFKTKCELLLELLNDDLARAQYRLGDIRYPHPIVFPADHPFASDLDLIGSHAFLKTIDNTFHAQAQNKLQRWLEEIDSSDVIRERQQAVSDLTDRVGFRHKLALAARQDSLRDLRDDDLNEWLAEKKPWTLSMPAYIFGRLTSLLTLASVVGHFFFQVQILNWLGMIVFQSIVFYSFDAVHGRFVSAFMQRGKAIAATCSAISLFERMRLNAPQLKQLQQSLLVNGVSAGPQLAHLMRVNEYLQYRANGLAHWLLNVFLMWDQHHLRGLLHWRDQYGAHLPTWVRCVFEVEALSALANHRRLYPGRPFPELSDDPKISINAKSLGHPAIAEDKRISNDYHLGDSGKLHLITGSNMSGKSTFLRTIGLNMLLARMGLPVCAESMTCTRPRLMTSIRINDSLADGVSYFYAEVQRIKLILDEIAQDTTPVLYLLDEILKGTNSRERLIATKTMVKFLLAHNASGLITTHDLELLAVEREDPDHITNYHFQESVRDEEMFFDYTLKPGELTSTNALRLMRMAGVPLDL